MDLRKIKKIRYPELETIMHQYPNPEVLLGKEIFWQEKRDGSNLGVWITRANNLRIRSRNMDNASKDMMKIFMRTAEAEKVRELLIDLRDQWNADCVIFGELLTKGKSPTRTELHEKDEFIVFDIFSLNFLSYTNVYQYCYQYKLQIVELYGTSRHTTMESLMKFRDYMLAKAKEKGREGVVGKIFDKEGRTRYFKEKLDLPQIEKLPRHIDKGEPKLPELAESEILGALDKVLVDIGYEKFRDVRVAMPTFVKYVKSEREKHNCRCTKGLYRFYSEKLEDMHG